MLRALCSTSSGVLTGLKGLLISLTEAYLVLPYSALVLLLLVVKIAPEGLREENVVNPKLGVP